MEAIEKITAKKINDLHNDLMGLMHQGIEKAIEIGQLLTEKKGELKHGEFGRWIKDNIVFTDRTARNYMKLFENKDKVLEAGSIADAYKMLGEGKTETVSDLETKPKRSFDNRMKVFSGLENFPVIADKVEFKETGLIFHGELSFDEWIITGKCLGTL